MIFPIIHFLFKQSPVLHLYYYNANIQHNNIIYTIENKSKSEDDIYHL